MARFTISNIAAQFTSAKEGLPLIGSKMDPYIVFEVNGARGQSKAVKNAGKEVEWSEPITIEGVSSTSSGSLTLAVYNHNTLRSDSLVGSGYVRVSDIRDGATQTVTLVDEKQENAGRVTFTINSHGAFSSGTSAGGRTGTTSTTTTGYSSGTTTGTGTGGTGYGAGAATGAGLGAAAVGATGTRGTTGSASSVDQTGYTNTGTAGGVTGTGIGTGGHRPVSGYVKGEGQHDERAVHGAHQGGSSQGIASKIADKVGLGGSKEGIGADDEVRGASSRTTTTRSTKEGIGADDEVRGATRGVQGLNVGSDTGVTRPQQTATHTEQRYVPGPSTTASTTHTQGGVAGVGTDFSTYKFKETHGRNTEEFVTYDKSTVCESRTYTVVEDRPIEREIITRVVEHRPVEKTFVVETRPVGERDVVSERHTESVGTTSRVVDVTQASSPCEGHPEVETVGQAITGVTTGQATTTGHASKTRGTIGTGYSGNVRQ